MGGGSGQSRFLIPAVHASRNLTLAVRSNFDLAFPRRPSHPSRFRIFSFSSASSARLAAKSQLIDLCARSLRDWAPLLVFGFDESGELRGRARDRLGAAPDQCLPQRRIVERLVESVVQ